MRETQPEGSSRKPRSQIRGPALWSGLPAPEADLEFGPPLLGCSLTSWCLAFLNYQTLGVKSRQGIRVKRTKHVVNASRTGTTQGGTRRDPCLLQEPPRGTAPAMLYRHSSTAAWTDELVAGTSPARLIQGSPRDHTVLSLVRGVGLSTFAFCIRSRCDSLVACAHAQLAYGSK